MNRAFRNGKLVDGRQVTAQVEQVECFYFINSRSRRWLRTMFWREYKILHPWFCLTKGMSNRKALFVLALRLAEVSIILVEGAKPKRETALLQHGNQHRNVYILRSLDPNQQ